MKCYFITAAMVIVCGFRLFCQEEPHISIQLNDEERFRFDSIRMEFKNAGHHVIIGDSAGMDDNANSQTVESTFLGFKAGSVNQDSWNTFLGSRAGEFHRTGNDNVYLGAWAGRYDSAGRYNTFVGANAGYSNNTGQMNTYIGRNTGINSDSSECNTFVGYNAGRDYHGVGYNSFFGRRAGEKNISGVENTFIGTSAGAECLTGSYNTFLGRGAGLNNLNGSGNVYIGYFAGSEDTASNQLIIANNNTAVPLVYGHFDGVFGLNALRMEFRNVFENTIIGDNSGYTAYGIQNVIIGNSAGNSLKGGHGNTFIGYQAGLADTSGSGNVFIGIQTGWVNTTGKLNAFVGTNAGFFNTTGIENTYLGTSAGASNTTGNYNTCLGRRAGIWNETGSGNIFIGYYAGANEMGSNKLYIANSDTTGPLIYGDFETGKLKFHADSVEATGEVRTNERFNVKGAPGIDYALNTVTDIDFANQKLKYRTIAFTGGIATFVSQESAWMDTVGPCFEPCGMLSLIGEFNEWQGDHIMTRNATDMNLWSTTIFFTSEDDGFPNDPDNVIEVKFRENSSWDVNWGAVDFPSGTGTQGGPNIPVPLDDIFDTTIYYLTFNCSTGDYDFENLSGYCPDSLTDARDGKKYALALIGNQCWMTQDLNFGLRIDASNPQTNNQTFEKYCYNDDEDNCTLWGGLYQWPELMVYLTTPGTQGICPEGFHVPIDAEFNILEGNIDSQYGPGSMEWERTGWRGSDAGLNLRSASWAGGTDAFGFHAVPGGYYSQLAGFNDGGACLNYQTSDSDISGNPWIRHLNGDFDQVTRSTNPSADGCTLRCLKD
jgi:uncharacterized protein (TIGR02145 family)